MAAKLGALEIIVALLETAVKSSENVNSSVSNVCFFFCHFVECEIEIHLRFFFCVCADYSQSICCMECSGQAAARHLRR